VIIENISFDPRTWPQLLRVDRRDCHLFFMMAPTRLRQA
jgi:hypothetical protein